jgi:D-tyrosyl-tRNA(Tyr) deacylase
MRAVVQRVAKADVKVENREVAAIEHGFLVLLGVHKDDSDEEAVWLARKLSGLRVFEDEDGKMNRCIGDVGGSVLAVSQFTLLADCKKGKRPSFTEAKSAKEGRRLFDQFVDELRRQGLEISTGVFGAKMEVGLVNDGPVTIVIDTPDHLK